MYSPVNEVVFETTLHYLMKEVNVSIFIVCFVEYANGWFVHVLSFHYGIRIGIFWVELVYIWSAVAQWENAEFAIERARVQILFATVLTFEHFHSLHDAPVHSAVYFLRTWLYE